MATENKTELIRKVQVMKKTKSLRAIAKELGIGFGTAQRYSKLDIRHLNDNQTKKEKPVRGHIYNPDTGDYIFTFPKIRTEPYRISKDRLQAIKRAYSNWNGESASINELCRTFQINRQVLTAIKNELGWTHDDSPFTDEELLSSSLDELTDDALQQRKQALVDKFNNKKWEETKKDAKKWNEFEQNVFLPLLAKIEEHAPKYKVPKLSIGKNKNKFAALINPCDSHWGLYGSELETGKESNHHKQEQWIKESTTKILEKVSRFGQPEKLYIMAGGDWFNSDGMTAATTKGTLQDNSLLPSEMFIYGCEMAVKQIDMLRQLGPVEVILAAGNHDKHNSLSLLMYLYAWYRNSKDVNVIKSPRSRQYFKYGKSGGLVTHGDTLSKTDTLATAFAHEEPKLWAETLWHYAITGHLHHEHVKEHGGLVHYQFNSLSGESRWSYDSGYNLARQALGGLIMDSEEGVIASLVQAV